MEKDLIQIAEKFELQGQVLSVRPLGEGFINDTYVVRTAEGTPDYILQRKNRNIFPDVPSMMGNIVKVTEHIKKKVKDPLRETLTVIRAEGGLPYYEDPDGEFWAVCIFIPDTVTYSSAKTPELAWQGGAGIGRFQTLLADFSEPLAETIPGFHNIRWRFRQWDECLAKDLSGRKSSLGIEIEWIESRRKQMLGFWELVENGTLPMRVTHNDTKISNILFDAATKEVLCAIDLDTVMSSTSLNDFGDAVRSYANTGEEDDRDPDKVSMDLEMFRAYTQGYLSQRKGSLEQSELDWLAFSALYITYEQVLRFLMDYIDGDRYYKIKYPGHNLVRTRAQYRLLQSMEAQYPQMCRIVREAAE